MKQQFIFLLLLFYGFKANAQNFKTMLDERDDHVYGIVQIGDQWWMSENLNFGIQNKSWYYNDDSINYHKLGRFYTYEVAIQACPSGWHLPSDEEWKSMEMILGLSRTQADGENLRGTIEGGKLKSTSSQYWTEPNINATNSSGFAAIGSGIRTPDGDYGHMKKGASFWTSTEGGNEMAWFRSLHSGRGDIHRGFYKKSFGYNVRCVKD